MGGFLRLDEETQLRASGQHARSPSSLELTIIITMGYERRVTIGNDSSIDQYQHNPTSPFVLGNRKAHRRPENMERTKYESRVGAQSPMVTTIPTIPDSKKHND